MQVCTENCDTAAITSPGIGVASDGVLRFTIPVQAGRPALDPEHPPSIGTSNKGGNKLRTYAIFKRNFHCEPYTKLSDKESRRWLAKFRCSDHSLRIETGRRQGLKPEERICLMCDNMTVEDEFHFLISCPKYDQLRLKLFKYISEKVPNFDNLPQRHKFYRVKI